MTTFNDVYPQIPPLQSPPGPLRVGHRASTVTGGHPLMGNPGAHVLPRKSRVLPYLAAVLLPLVGVLLVLLAVRMAGQPSDHVVPPVLQVSVSPSACTFPDGS